MTDYFDSYYSDTRIDASASELTLQSSYDVIVIGGGLAGLTSAVELSKQGKSVALLEHHHIGWGASGRNGGFVFSGFAAGMSEIEARVGLENAQKLYALSKEGMTYVKQMIDHHQMTRVNPIYGKLVVSRIPNSDEFERTVDNYYSKYNENARFVKGSELSDILKTERYHGARFHPDAFHIHPLNYCLELKRIALEIGVDIFEQCPALSLDPHQDYWCVTTKNGEITAPHIVVAGSAYLTKIAPVIERAILPVSTYVVVTEPMADKLDNAITKPYAISDTRRAGDYYRRLADGRLLWGGRITTRTSVPTHLRDMMKKDITKIYPQLGDFNITHAWAGWMGYAIHKMPIIGQIKPGLWSATGFGGHGLNTTAMAGLVVSKAICGIQDDTILFKKFPAMWGGGVFGRIATQFAYWGMQARDAWDER